VQARGDHDVSAITPNVEPRSELRASIVAHELARVLKEEVPAVASCECHERFGQRAVLLLQLCERIVALVAWVNVQHH
jgi:hypothetical protein